jgi:hypothetical protein
VIGQGTGLRPRDRSCDRNEQHCAALGHHPANAARPRCAVRSGTSLHLLIAGLLVRVGAQPGVVARRNPAHPAAGSGEKLAIWLEPTGRWEPKRGVLAIFPRGRGLWGMGDRKITRTAPLPRADRLAVPCDFCRSPLFDCWTFPVYLRGAAFPVLPQTDDAEDEPRSSRG